MMTDLFAALLAAWARQSTSTTFSQVDESNLDVIQPGVHRRVRLRGERIDTELLAFDPAELITPESMAPFDVSGDIWWSHGKRIAA
jgi:hypothetical protein